MLKGHEGIISSLATLRHPYLVSGSWDETVRIWNVETGIENIKLSCHSAITALAATDELLALGSDKGMIE